MLWPRLLTRPKPRMILVLLAVEVTEENQGFTLKATTVRAHRDTADETQYRTSGLEEPLWSGDEKNRSMHVQFVQRQPHERRLPQGLLKEDLRKPSNLPECSQPLPNLPKNEKTLTIG